MTPPDAPEYSVYQYFPDGRYERVLVFVPAKEALTRAKQLTESVGGRMGTTAEVIITDGDDCCIFQWKHGQGVVFPKLEPTP